MSLARLRESLTGDSTHFSPFFVLGDPDAETSFEICRAAITAGATMLELGLPFSDPAADGPVIQAACRRARAAGVSINDALAIMARLRGETDTPFNLLVYGNLVHARGLAGFVGAARDAGASSLLAPDIPLEEGDGLRAACVTGDLGLVQLVGPAATDERVQELATGASVFLYVVGHQGTTGARSTVTPETLDLVRRVSGVSPLPVCVGFGLREPAHVRAVLAAGARIAIVGSALVQRIGALASDGRDRIVEDVRAEVARLASAAQGSK